MARRRRHNQLGWALALSLLLNHTLILPGVYTLLFSKPRKPPAETVEVELVDPPVMLPDEPVEPPVALPLDKLRQERPKKKRAKKKKKKKVAIRKKQPPKPPEKKQKKPKPRPPQARRMKMVIVNNPESKAAPDDARYLSDKNRRVERETRARQTSLIKNQRKPQTRSEPNPRKDPLVGVKKRRVPSEEPKKVVRKRQRAPSRRNPLSMRNPVPLITPRAAVESPLARTPVGSWTAEQKPRRRVRQRLKLNLDHRSHDRIFGDKARKEREVARLSPSSAPRGKHQRKWARVRASLENFIPEVRPGNQTALGTRADPFAAYIHRMHLGIHKLWGWGFLVDLDGKPDGNMMNDMTLWTMIEVVVAPSGKVDKATIVKPSGVLPFDVAALDTIFSAGPYAPPPRAIRSADGKVYMHWRFHRNHRQCGTFGVDPYVLTTPPTGLIDGDFTEVKAEPRTAGEASPRPAPKRSKPAPSLPPATNQDKTTDRRRATAAARGFVEALKGRDATAMASHSTVPFASGDETVAESHQRLKELFTPLVTELGGKTVSNLSLMTPMQARKTIGYFPKGVNPGKTQQVARVTVGDTPLTLVLEPRGDVWKVVGLNR